MVSGREAAPAGEPVLWGALGGGLAGLVLGVITWFHSAAAPDSGLDFARVAGFAGAVMTAAHFTVAHALFGLVIGSIVAIASLLVRRRPPPFVGPSLAFGLSFGLFFLALSFVDRNLSLPRNISLTDPMRMAVLKSAVLVGVAVAAGAFALAVPLFGRARPGRLKGALTAIIAVALVISIAGLVSLDRSSAIHRAIGAADWRPTDNGKVVIVGVDGATWELIDPLISEGLLPNIERMRDQGVYANLVTHGRRLSPAVWTGIATGWSHAKHGIVGWTVPEPGTGLVRPIQSNDRRKPALWQILSEFDKSVVVVNWLVTYPSEPTNGVIVSRIVDLDPPAVFPPELFAEVTAAVDSSRAATSAMGPYISEVQTLFDLTARLIRKGQPDLLMLYVNATDKAQHRYWAAHQPERFDASWGLDEDYFAEGRRVLRELWAEVDRRLGELEESLEDGTTLVVVSDHGFRPSSKGSGLVRINEVLGAMGYVCWIDDTPGELDFARTRAFSAGLDVYDPMLGFYVNVEGRQAEGIVPPDSADVVAARLARDLAGLCIEETGEPLFLRVGLVSEGGPERLKGLGYDVYAEKGSPVRIAAPGRTVRIAGTPYELDDFTRKLSDTTGNHAPRGVLVAVGPHVRRGAVRQLVADCPYTVLLTYITGYRPGLERLYMLLRRLGFLDPLTSIDVAPTVLYLLGLPVSSSMEGRLMEPALDPELMSRRPVTMVSSYDHLRTPQAETEGTISQETLEQLRALGYIQ
jgi:predicted AlkP superfamily phosphohydrolase/phosphomutase